MQAIQVVLDEELLRAANRAARGIRKNRSALIRDALREHLKRLRLQELERRDRRGYESHPGPDDLAAWERVAEWPRE
jgi:metal-responsive CopG/Arc/MetJ family transcriptional regulator